MQRQNAGTAWQNGSGIFLRQALCRRAAGGKKLISAGTAFDEITVLTESTGKLKEVNLLDGGVLQLSTAEECPEITKNRLRCRLLWPVMNFVSAQGVTATGFTRMAAQAAKIKDYFIDNKVPRAERDKKLLVTAGSKVLWIIGERQAGWKTRPDGKWLVMRLAGRKDEKNE